MTLAIDWIKKNKVQIVIFIITIFQLFYYTGCDYIGIEHADTISYAYHSFAIADIGARPPIYPLLIAACRMAFGQNRCYAAVCLFQIVLSTISMILFYYTTKRVCSNKNIALLITLFYGCNPAPLEWNISVMTESLSMSITVIFLYFVVKYIVEDDITSGIFASVVSLIAMFIKPTLVVYCGVCFAMIVLQFFFRKEMRKTLFRVAVANFCCIAVVVGYSGLMYKYNGTFSVSNLGPRHSLAVCLADGNYKNYHDADLVEQIQDIYEQSGKDFASHTVTTEIMNLFGEDTISRHNGTVSFVKECNSYNKTARYEFVIDNVIGSIKNEGYTLGWLYYKNANIIVNIMSGIQKYVFGIIENRLAWLFVIPLITLISTILLWIKNKECPWIHLGITGMLCVIIVSNYMGSYDSFYRLTVYALPVMYLGVGAVVDQWFGKVDE